MLSQMKTYIDSVHPKKVVIFVHEHHKSLGLIIILFIIIFSIISNSKIKADSLQTFLYPTNCYGDWQNSNLATGESDIKFGNNFSKDNSAVLENSSSEIDCSGFGNDILADALPQKITLKLSWLVVDKPVEQIPSLPILEDSQIPVPEVLYEVAPPVEEVQTPPSDIVPPAEDIITPPVETPAPDQTPPADTTPPPAEEVSVSPIISFFSATNLFSKISNIKNQLFAQIISSSENSQDFMEVFYTIDGAAWKSLGVVNKSNYHDANFEISDPSIVNWQDLSKLTIALRPITTDNQPTIYLDNMYLKIEYKKSIKFSEISPVKSLINSDTPTFYFSSPTDGSISYIGRCSSWQSMATVGENKIVFNKLSDDFYDDCFITVTDLEGKIGDPLYITPFTVDTTAPRVTSVISSAENKNYTDGTIPINIIFSEKVFVEGIPFINISTGKDKTTPIYYESGSGTNLLTFSYHIASKDSSYDLEYTGINALSVNDGSIRDESGNDANLVLPEPHMSGSLGFNKNISIGSF